MGKYSTKKQIQPKKVLTNAEKAELFTKQQTEQIANKIEEGTMEVNAKKRRIKSPPKIPSENEEQTLEDIESNLKLLRANIIDQRKEQKEIERAKLAKAHQLITKMKKQKEEHKIKIQQQQQKSILHSRIFSQSTIGKMRQKLQERIDIKRKQIEQRVKSIAARQQLRQKRAYLQQNQYWDNVKKLNKQTQSSKQLPSLLNPQLPSGRRKSVALLQRKKSLQSLRNEEQKGKKIQILLKKAQLQHDEPNRRLVEHKNEERLNKIINNNNKLASKLGNQNQFMANIQKSKLYGDQYLKESLLKVKKNQSCFTQCNSEQLPESIQLKAHQKYINPNQQVQKLRENYDRMLSRLRHYEVTQQQGLELLNSMERRLDKVDISGMKDRLQRKCEVLEQLQGEKKQAKPLIASK